ncbi:OPA3-domain-containing protein [Cylindrobasidium torrendii FP15055 ss-10]|uniref:OPA3-domain-containing protein n=1 Tax=Cylindrobasidium torrendii FP15055 ss-10 TaxID=1314674 RepID=A0A0D7BMC2_9AGAR|nr:OPA3-domain-containing protein [Cylindrobasidium torrendii FP15055 ss-10]
MASTKIATLVIRTLAKPISVRLKEQAKKHDTFRHICVSLAQYMHRSEIRLRTGLLGEPTKHVRPLSETRAIDTGANFIAEGFMFAVAAGLILGETYRSSRKETQRRDDVKARLDDLETSIQDLTQRVGTLATTVEEQTTHHSTRNDEMHRILQRIVDIGLRGGWAEFEKSPLQLPLPTIMPSRLIPSPPTNASEAREDQEPSAST